MTARAGKAYKLPWRVTWYVRDPVTGRPVGGGRRAYATKPRADKAAGERRAEGYTAEVFRQLELPRAA